MTTPTQGEHAQPEALRPEMLDDLIETFRTASLGRYNLMRVELPRHQWEQLAAELGRHAAPTQPAAPQGGAYAELPEFEELDDDLIDLACSTGALYRVDFRRAWEVVREGLRASHGQAPAVATLDVFGLQWPGEDRINLSTVFDTEAEALEYRDNRCDTPGILVVRLFAQPTHTAQPAPAATPQADSAQNELISREEWVERAMRVYLIAGDTEDEARECAEYQWGELDMDDIPDPYFTAMEDIEGRGPAPQADSQPAPDETIDMAREQGLPETETEGVFMVNVDDLCRVIAADRATRAPADSVTAPAAGAVAGPGGWREALEDSLSVMSSVSTSRDRRVVRDGCVLYLQTEEWCKWLEDEVGPKIAALLAAAPTPAAQGEALDRVTNFRHEAEGMVRGGEWVRLSDVRAALAQKEGK